MDGARAARFTAQPITSGEVKGTGSAKAKKRPFDILRLAWHDYPVEWFEESPSSEEGSEPTWWTRSGPCCVSDVAVLLVDGQKLLDYKDEEERYLKSLLTNFRQGLLQTQGGTAGRRRPLGRVPAHLDHCTFKG
jgi:hypothetical protein